MSFIIMYNNATLIDILQSGCHYIRCWYIPKDIRMYFSFIYTSDLII